MSDDINCVFNAGEMMPQAACVCVCIEEQLLQRAQYFTGAQAIKREEQMK